MSLFNFGYNRRPSGLFSQLDDPANIAAIAQRRVPTAMPQEDEEERRRGSGLLSNLGLRIFGDDNRFFGQQEDGSTFRDRMMMAGMALGGDASGAEAYRQGLQEQQQTQLQAQAEAERQRLERERIVQQGRALGLQGEELSRFFLAPEEVRTNWYDRSVNPQAPDAPTTRTVNRGGEIVTEQWNPQTQQFEEIGRAPRWNADAQPLVNVNTGDNGEQLSPFQRAMSEAEGEMFAGFIERAPQANRNLIRIDQLEGLLAESGSGIGAAARARAADFGLQLGDDVGELQAARALINSMVPEQRPPGSGPMSDADLALFQQSLPRLINTPEGNRIIIETMRAINQYDAALGQIAQLAADGQITQAEARRQVNMLNNPIDGVRDALGGRSNGRSGAPAVGDIVDGYEFLGGNPADQNNWRRV